MKSALATLAVTAFISFPRSYAADETKQPAASQSAYAVQVGATPLTGAGAITTKEQKPADPEKQFQLIGSEMLRLDGRFKAQLQEKKWEEAGKTADEIARLVPSPPAGYEVATKDDLEIVRTEYRVRILMAKGDAKAAIQEVAGRWTASKTTGPILFFGMAETLLADPELPGDGLDLTTEILSSINQKSAVKSFATLAALARATFMKGDKEQAVGLQEQAIKIQAPYVTEEHRQKHGDKYHSINVGNQKRLQAQLASYAAGKLPPSER